MILSLFILIVITISCACITAMIVATYLLTNFRKNIEELEEIQCDLIDECMKKE